ncbi:MAG: TRZ/ATZ family protein [Synergistaceae bacterium]|nr:FumA C-terminus/TtdB family hydratase beta subunit [Synergistota bacterium]NLM71338.1 TRZ/ATZ family protein [Synergistaceae bacterium]
MSPVRVQTPLTEAVSRKLEAGDELLLSGRLYVARDAAHRLIVEALGRGEQPPVDLGGAVIFYAGPAPARSGMATGAIGPTTSYRMDPFTPLLLKQGVLGMIGKGMRSKEVISCMMKHGAVYLGATGGIAALLARTVISSRVVCYEELGPEALRELETRDMPLTVLIDSKGRSIYSEGPAKFIRSRTP